MSRLGVLTKMERQVFTLIAWGLSYKQIAKRLHVCCRTVETHRQKAAKRLGLDDFHDLIRLAVAEGIYNTPPEESNHANCA